MYQKLPSKKGRMINRPFAPVISLQHHRTAKAGRDLQRSSGPMALLKQDHPKLVVQGHVQTAFECPQRWKSLGSQCSVILKIKKCFPIFRIFARRIKFVGYRYFKKSTKYTRILERLSNIYNTQCYQEWVYAFVLKMLPMQWPHYSHFPEISVYTE